MNDKIVELNQRLDAAAAALAEIRNEHDARVLKAGPQQPIDTLSNARWIGISLTGGTDQRNGSAGQA